MRALLRAAGIFCSLALPPTVCLATPFSGVYDFTNLPGDQASTSVTTQPAGAVMSDITRGSGLTATAGIHSINSATWTNGTAINANDYYTISITPDAGNRLNLSTLTFLERRSATGIRTIEVRSSLDSFGSAIGSPIGVPDDTNFRQQLIDLSAVQFQNITSMIVFRIYGYRAENALGDGTWRFGDGDINTVDLALNGDVSAVPEPASVVLVMIAGGAGVVWQRRRQRSKTV